MLISNGTFKKKVNEIVEALGGTPEDFTPAINDDNALDNETFDAGMDEITNNVAFSGKTFVVNFLVQPPVNGLNWSFLTQTSISDIIDAAGAGKYGFSNGATTIKAICEGGVGTTSLDGSNESWQYRIDGNLSTAMHYFVGSPNEPTSEYDVVIFALTIFNGELEQIEWWGLMGSNKTGEDVWTLIEP